VEIDNNAAERALRAVAPGRKNFLHLGSNSGGERRAAIYTLVGTAKLNGLDPEAYAPPHRSHRRCIRKHLICTVLRLA
jgi:transposase